MGEYARLAILSRHGVDIGDDEDSSTSAQRRRARRAEQQNKSIIRAPALTHPPRVPTPGHTFKGIDMATKKPAAPKTPPVPAVLKPAGGSLASPMEALKAFALRGRQQLAKVPSGGVGVSFRGGTITVGGVRVGNSMPVIALHPQFERTYYDREFSAEDKAPPPCYSFDGVKPHEKASSPQSETCERCQHAQWGTDRRGKGKACKEGMRMVFMRADSVDPDSIKVAPLMTAKFSVMNSKIVGPVLERLYETAGHPAGVVCNLECHPDDATQIRNDLVPVGPLEDVAAQDAVISRLDEAEKLATQPYPDPEVSAAPAAKKAPARARKF